MYRFANIRTRPERTRKPIDGEQSGSPSIGFRVPQSWNVRICKYSYPTGKNPETYRWWAIWLTIYRFPGTPIMKCTDMQIFAQVSNRLEINHCAGTYRISWTYLTEPPSLDNNKPAQCGHKKSLHGIIRPLLGEIGAFKNKYICYNNSKMGQHPPPL
jgi:hypothetical protein